MADEKLEFAERTLLRFRGLHGPTLLIAQVGTERHVDVAREARLTAAAPLLLAACQMAVQHYEKQLGTMGPMDVRLLRQAIHEALHAEPEPRSRAGPSPPICSVEAGKATRLRFLLHSGGLVPWRLIVDPGASWRVLGLLAI